jgi:transposase-like protein
MFIMGSTRRGFTPEYKDEAVKLVINTGRAVATVARELGVKEQTLGRWVHELNAAGFPDDVLGDLAGPVVVVKTGAVRSSAS